MPIRVIAGSAKGRRLKQVPGDTTRPVMDRVKEALFSILGEGIIDSHFLDLFAGTGSVGIEALSRGAEYAVFVELAKAAVKTIQQNITATEFTEYAEVIWGDALKYLQREVPSAQPTPTEQGAPQSFDYIYIVPPQYQGLWLQALKILDEYPENLNPDGTVIVQIDPSEKQDTTLVLKNLQPFDERRYGNTLLWFYEIPTQDEDEAAPAETSPDRTDH
jgi:16S rRNA (guanine966-N2)-methyltransferase